LKTSSHRNPAKCRLNTGRDSKGKFKKGCSGNPSGKKPGTRNKRTEWIELLTPIHDDLFKVVSKQALRGCRASQRLLFERIWPALKSTDESFDARMKAIEAALDREKI